MSSDAAPFAGAPIGAAFLTSRRAGSRAGTGDHEVLSFRLRMEFSEGSYSEAAAVLRSLVGPVRTEPGCSATRLLRDTKEGHSLTWVEEWRSTRDFEQHLRTTGFRRILAVMELAAAPPVVEIDEVISRRGFELVEQILGEVSPRGSVDAET